ncbi:hypothetical protein [uncultured Desulfovibrio sp.]|uniref:hypothetical protein n=1 Tax=uncultured Desulfovibrio sp. TaxID=167968 RepID=UPI0027299660|nr:hypothetical protein [uncultured Desulfovibrio sp.]
MPFPRFARRLFENEGAGPLLNKDIIPPHADTHAMNGSDPISPASVGAASAADLEALRTATETMISALAAQMTKLADPWNCIPCRVPIPVEGVTFPEVEETRPVLNEEGQAVLGEDGEPLTETVSVKSRHPIMPGETEPRENWFICDGGSDGKGGTVPDLRGRMILCASDTHQVGDTGGSETHEHSLSGTVGATTLTVAQLASHTHVVPNQTGKNTSGSHIDGWSWNSAINTYATGGAQPHTHDLTAVSSGASSTLPPYFSLAFVMRIA